MQCLKWIDHANMSPIPLKGTLVVTYEEPSIDKTKGDNHELGLFDLAHPEKKIRRITSNLVNESEIEISPNGRTFLYTVRRKLDDFEHNSEIWQMNIDGSNAHRLAGGQPMGVPAWIYPDGKKFMFIKWGKSIDSQLYIMNVAKRQVTPYLPHLKGPADPESSYNGRLVTFKMAVKGDKSHQPSIYVMNSDGSDLKRLTRGFSDHDPVFSRDNTRIYFERYYGPGDWFEASKDRSKPQHNRWGIVEVNLKTGKEKIIVPHDPCGKHWFWLPTVSPDGQYLMYIHNVATTSDEKTPWTELWVSKVNGENPQKVPGSDGFYFFDWTQ